MRSPFTRFFLCLALVASSLTAAASAAAPVEPWPAGAAPDEVGHRLAERFVQSPHGNVNRPPPKEIPYAEVCAWYGALRYAHATSNAALREKLIARFEPFFGPEANLIPPPVHVDRSVFGALPLELYRQTHDTRYRELGLRSADAQWAQPTARQREALPPALRATSDEALQQGLSWQTRFWIDDMYMITILQTQAYRATGDMRYLDRAANEAVAYLGRLQQPNGLFFHAPDVPFFWGRGDGWFAAGMSELLRSLPADHPQRGRILAGYRKMMASLLRYQAEDGMWRQLIDHPEAWPESSCTAMFTFAFVEGVKHGWLDAATYGPAARKGWLALVRHIDANGAVTDVCEGTNKKNDLQYYLHRDRVTGDLHGQAPVLWCAAAWLE